MMPTVTQVEGPGAIVGALAVGFIGCAICVVGLMAFVELIRWWDEVRAEKLEAAAKVADATRSFSEEWVPEVEDVQAILEEHPTDMPRSKGFTKPVLKKDGPGRLVEHMRRYGGAR